MTRLHERAQAFTLGAMALLTVALVDGCSDDEGTDTPSTGGVAGASGVAGAAGTAGSTGGTGGSGGAAGADASTDADSDAADASQNAMCGNCHATIESRLATGSHAALAEGCLTCHPGALAHQADPANVKAKLDFGLSLCGSCHKDYQDSYLKDDGTKPGKYGGSLKTSKYVDFPAYKHLMGGHGFTVEYNEERAHAYMLKDHREIARKQNTVCLQCKSTPVAYYFNEQRRGEYPFSMTMTWDQVIQSVTANWADTLDYGANCTHCHDPHGTSFRLVRKAMISAIMERGTDPYDPSLTVYPKTAADLFAKMNEKGTDGKLTASARRLAGTLTCAQCHVEYVCGPGVDKDKGILRDDFPWRKLRDIEQYYLVKYDVVQDWKHSGTGLPGIKAQHPETEFFWESKHYAAGVSCVDCHMTKVGAKTSHWLTSPFKDAQGSCGKCHSDYSTRVQTVQSWQDQTWNQAKGIETALDQVLSKIEQASADPNFDQQKLQEAKQLFMRSLLWWEWTIVSENSTGAHNPTEAKTNLDTATVDVDKAKTLLGL